MSARHGLQWISRLFWEVLEPEGITAIGGLTMGADPLVTGLMLHSLQVGRPLDGFLVRRNHKDPGTLGQVEGNLAGHKRVAILDDVITSGESALVAAEAAESYRAQVVRIVTVVDRNQGAAQVFQQRGYPFTPIFTVNDLLPAERG
jgi:orotate phosphoribosyltransferase